MYFLTCTLNIQIDYFTRPLYKPQQTKKYIITQNRLQFKIHNRKYLENPNMKIK